MSQKARRTWAVWAVCIAIIAAGFVAVWQVGLGPAGARAASPPAASTSASEGVAGEPSPSTGLGQAMDAAEYARLAELRERLRLMDEAFCHGAGMGCDPSTGSGQAAGPSTPSTSSGEAGSGLGTAEAVPMRLREWHEANAAAWGARLLATAAARRDLQAALRRVNVGPPTEAARLRAAQAQAALAAAMQAEGEAMDSLRAFVGGALADAQRAAWLQLCAAPADAGPCAFAPGNRDVHS